MSAVRHASSNNRAAVRKEFDMQIGVDSARAVENKRVFVIDSDDVTGMALQFMLADEMETHVFADTEAALATAPRAMPDLVLLGAALLAHAAGHPVSQIKHAMPNARVLVVCLDAEDACVRQALAQGADGTLLRPLKIEAVRRQVDAQLGRRSPLHIPVVQG